MNTQELTPASIVALFETNKAQRESFVSTLVESIDNGNVDPLKIHLQIKCMEDIIKQLNDNPIYRDAILTQAQTYSQKEFEFMNAKIAIREVGVKYNYDNCNDNIFKKMVSEKNTLDEKMKARQKFLQLAPIEGTLVTDEETGETEKIYPATKTSTTSLVVTLK